MVVVVVLILIALIAPYFLNADRYRGTISNLITQQTGRQVKLGKIRATILPRLGFAVEEFHMGNPQDFAPGEFVSAAEISGSLAFWPLVLRREYRLTSVELVRPKLLLLEDEHGRNNYTFSPTVSSSVASKPSAGQARPAGPEQGGSAHEAGAAILQVDDVTLRDAIVIYGSVDGRGRTMAIVDASGFNVDLHHLALQPLRVREWQVEAKLGGARMALANWKVPITFHSGSVTLRGGDLESSFAVDFDKGDFSEGAHINGTLSIANVEHAMVKFDLKTADIDIPALMADGQTANFSGDLPSNIAGNPVDNRVGTRLNTRSGAHSSNPQASISAAGEQAASNSATVASELVAQGHLAAERIHSALYVTGPATADVRLYTDRLEVWPVTIRLYGGSLQISARTDRRQTPMRFSTNVEARNLDLEQMLDVSPSLRRQFAGTGEFDLQVIGSLDETWKRSLTGNGQFAIRNGRIKGFNLAGAAQSIANLAGVAGDTAFTAITGDINIRDERVNSRDIHLDSPRGTADLRGSSGLDGSINYDGQIGLQLGTALSSSASDSGNLLGGIIGTMLARNGGKLTVPFVLRGTFQHPELGPGHAMPNFPEPNQPKPKCCSFPNMFQK